MDMVNFKRQHIEVAGIIDEIKTLIKNGAEENAEEIAFNINVLSGKLRIHLEGEDNFLYPKLLESDNDNIRNLTNSYIKEMGSINQAFQQYKLKYNIKGKILGNLSGFTNDTNEIFAVLEQRISKEDNELYTLL